MENSGCDYKDSLNSNNTSEQSHADWIMMAAVCGSILGGHTTDGKITIKTVANFVKKQLPYFTMMINVRNRQLVHHTRDNEGIEWAEQHQLYNLATTMQSQDT